MSCTYWKNEDLSALLDVIQPAFAKETCIPRLIWLWFMEVSDANTL